jgi:DNA-binding NarL/FixJ family response regulator
MVHKMSITMHKNAPVNVVSYLKKYRPAANGSIDHKSSQNAKIKENMSAASKIAVIDIEKQNRLSKVISMYSKGLNQEEIALELHVDQSTVSRDLQYIKHEATIKIEKYLREDILFEYVRYMAGSNEITRHL